MDIFKVSVCTKHFLTICRLSHLFCGDGNHDGGGQFFDIIFSYSKRVRHHLTNLQVSYGVIGKFFKTNLH